MGRDLATDTLCASFMAPEVCAGAAQTDFRRKDSLRNCAAGNAGGAHGKSADVWSCGVTLFAIVAGYLPWEETQLLNLSAAICNEPSVTLLLRCFPRHRSRLRASVRIPPHVSADLSDLIDRMLHKDPADRIVMDDIRVRVLDDSRLQS